MERVLSAKSAARRSQPSNHFSFDTPTVKASRLLQSQCQGRFNNAPRNRPLTMPDTTRCLTELLQNRDDHQWRISCCCVAAWNLSLGKGRLLVMGQSRHFYRGQATIYPRTTDIARPARLVRLVPRLDPKALRYGYAHGAAIRWLEQ